MGRMIDADAFMEAMYHLAFETDDDTMWQSGCWVRYRAVEQTVREQPTVDAVPVVRCKDCKWYKKAYSWNGNERRICVLEPYEPVRKDDDFCNRGANINEKI